MAVNNKVQLITYPDSLGGDLKTLKRVLDQHFPQAFDGGVHILPPFPSSGDRGFAPLTYLEIDPAFGSWEDIREIGGRSPVLLDLIVNHMSAQSPAFQDYLQNGSSSRYADLFIPVEKHWPDGRPPRDAVERMFRRREYPFSAYPMRGTGESRTLWTTFGRTDPSEQVDIDVNSPMARKLLTDCMSTFSRNNARMVRLDAVGYVIKKPGTSCFFVEPEIWQFLDWVRSLATSLDIELLPEVHADFPTQQRLSEHGFWIYDFVLPYRILEALLLRNSRQLRAYLANRPQRQFTMLDCHDGIPIKPDLDGMYSPENARRVVEICLQRGGNVSRIMSSAFKEPDGFDVHQIGGTYYSMLGCDDTAYLAARAIQFFVPGIPQVYYIGLLAGVNDPAARGSGDGRDINRHNYSLAEIERDVQRPVVRTLLRLIAFRNTHPAFNGTFTVDDGSDYELLLRWHAPSAQARLHVDLQENTFDIRYSEPGSQQEKVLETL